MSAPASNPPPNVTILLNILDKPQEEHIKLAIATIQGSGTKSNGDPCYSAHQAEQHFGVPRTTLGHHLQGMLIV